MKNTLFSVLAIALLMTFSACTHEKTQTPTSMVTDRTTTDTKETMKKMEDKEDEKMEKDEVKEIMDDKEEMDGDKDEIKEGEVEKKMEKDRIEDTGEEVMAVQEVTASLGEWYLNLSKTTVKAGKVKFTVKNEGQYGHILGIEGFEAETKKLTAGESTTITYELAAGTYTVICPIPGHKAKGQVNTLVVE